MNGVQRVAIIVIDTSKTLENDTKDANALRDRLLEKGKLAKIEAALAVKTKAALPEPEPVRIFTLETKGDSKFQGGSAVAKEIATFLKGATKYGIYIIMHGESTGLPSPSNKTSLFPKSIGDFLRSIIKLHGTPAALKKVNLVACNFAMPLARGHALLPSGKTYGDQLCEALANEGTMVAAYTVPVYVYWKGNPELAGGVTNSKPDPEAKHGQKLVDRDQSSLDYATRLSADNRATYKKVWAFRGGAVAAVTMDEYHNHN